MAESIRPVQYVYVTVRNRPGAGAAVLAALKEARVNLLAFSGFPVGKGMSQVDLVTSNIAGVKKVAKAKKWKLSPVKKGFLAQGSDRIGAVADILGKLAKAKVNVIAADAVTAGSGKYGMIFWVEAASRAKAAKALGAK